VQCYSSQTQTKVVLFGLVTIRINFVPAKLDAKYIIFDLWQEVTFAFILILISNAESNLTFSKVNVARVTIAGQLQPFTSSQGNIFSNFIPILLDYRKRLTRFPEIAESLYELTYS
jgi:hypothetical protein